MKTTIKENELIQYLEAEADLDCFYIYRAQNVRPGLVHYVDRGGSAWVLMEDNDALVEAAVRFLIDRGNPVFESLDEASAYEMRLKMDKRE
jgi:hypothetical protein